MKKNIVTFVLLFAPVVFLQAQVTTPPNKTTPDIRERLVELALNNPAVKIKDSEKTKTVTELNKAGANWLNYVTASANFNEITLRLRDNGNNNQLYYPLWNVGINVPIGSLFQRGGDVKIARKNVDIAMEQQELMRRQIKALVLAKYEDYLKTQKLLEIQREALDEDQTAFEQAEAKIATASISYNEYSNASRRFKESQAQKIMLERDLSVTKLEIEEIIGVKLEDVLAQK
jgi:outer membrane protein TolC